MASTTTTEQKARLRRTIREQVAAMTAEERRESDGALLRRFLSLPELALSDTVLLFWGMGAEPDTRELISNLTARDKTVGLPRCLPGGELEFRQYRGEDAMTVHLYGMREPDLACPVISPQKAQLALIPAVCYDENCLRLGRGGGFYDRFLAGYSGFTVGLCRGRLLQKQCPAEPHDRWVELVVTENDSFRHVYPKK